MVALAAWFDGNSDDPTVVRTTAQLDEVLDLVIGSGGPRVVQLLVQDDPARAIFDVGLDGQRGALYFSSTDHPGGCFSRGSEAATPTPLTYYYMGSDTEYPASAELPVAVVRRAAHEYLATGGERPTSVDWQPSPW
jgi:hypothetical protein